MLLPGFRTIEQVEQLQRIKSEREKLERENIQAEEEVKSIKTKPENKKFLDLGKRVSELEKQIEEKFLELDSINSGITEKNLTFQSNIETKLNRLDRRHDIFIQDHKIMKKLIDNNKILLVDVSKEWVNLVDVVKFNINLNKSQLGVLDKKINHIKIRLGITKGKAYTKLMKDYIELMKKQGTYSHNV